MANQLLLYSEARQNLYKKYVEASDCEKLLVQVFSLFDYLRGKDFYAFIKNVTLSERNFKDKEWKDAFIHCIEKQLLKVEYGDTYRVNPLLCMLGTEDVMKIPQSEQIERVASIWRKNT